MIIISGLAVPCIIFVMILIGLGRRECFVVSSYDEDKSVGHEKPEDVVAEETSEGVGRAVQNIEDGGADEEEEDGGHESDNFSFTGRIFWFEGFHHGISH